MSVNFPFRTGDFFADFVFVGDLRGALGFLDIATRFLFAAGFFFGGEAAGGLDL